MAGQENRIHTELPVYFVQAPSRGSIDPSSKLGVKLQRIGEEILQQARPKQIVLLVPVETTEPYVQISTLDRLTYSSLSGSQRTLQGHPSLAQSLTTTLAYASPPVQAVSGRQNLHEGAGHVLDALFGSSIDLKVVQVSIPVVQRGGWDSEQYFDAGHAMLKMRKNEQDVVIVAIGKLGLKTEPSFSALLDDALAHHTHHPRLVSLVSLLNALSGMKPTRQVSKSLAALYTAIGAAGEGEGERLDKEGTCWRFGHLPIVKNPKFLSQP